MALSDMKPPAAAAAFLDTHGWGHAQILPLAGEAPSPTFAIVQPYAPSEVEMPIAHVDLYRIEDESELIELGLDDYRYDGALLIEWPERLGSQGWPDALSITISGSGDARVLTADVPTSWGSRWPLR